MNGPGPHEVRRSEYIHVLTNGEARQWGELHQLCRGLGTIPALYSQNTLLRDSWRIFCDVFIRLAWDAFQGLVGWHDGLYPLSGRGDRYIGHEGRAIHLGEGDNESDRDREEDGAQGELGRFRSPVFPRRLQ